MSFFQTMKPFQQVRHWLQMAFALLLVVGLTAGCGGNGSPTASTTTTDPEDISALEEVEPLATPAPAGFIATDPTLARQLRFGRGRFTLQILHASDFEAGARAVEDAPNFSAVVNGLRSERRFPNTIVLSSGDNYLPSPFYNSSLDREVYGQFGIPNIFSAAPGLADIAILNAIGIQAAAFGNHEFDQGTNQVSSLLRKQNPPSTYPGTRFPYLSSNLDFGPDSNLAGQVTGDGQEASAIPNKIAKTAVLTVAGEKIGLVGATTANLRSISTPGDVVVNGGTGGDPNQVDFGIIQASVDQLLATGINKVILLAHLQQVTNELQLASQLRGVDVIIGGGSHRVFAKPSDRIRPEDKVTGDYPVLRRSASGEPVALVNTGANYRYVGRLIVTFDRNGVLSAVDRMSGAYATDAQGVSESGGRPNTTVVSLANQVGQVIARKDGNTFGRTEVFLNGLRAEVRTEETNLGDLSADANLAFAKTQDPTTVISLKNGGGIRSAIGAVQGGGGDVPPVRIPPVANEAAGKEEGEVSQLDIEASLSFNNGLSLVTVTAAQLEQVLEHGVGRSVAGSQQGRFPQVGGMAFSYQPPTGTTTAPVCPVNGCVRSVKVGSDVVVRDGVVVGDPNRTFRMVTLNFLAGGGDSYPFPTFPNLNRVDLIPAGVTPVFDTFGSEQDALARFLAQKQIVTTAEYADTPVSQDLRIQNLSKRSDTVLN
jgi:2',3'-cyclic-nucleotide 2'-phosphodiesterase (5'-nucleotidase family)